MIKYFLLLAAALILIFFGFVSFITEPVSEIEQVQPVEDIDQPVEETVHLPDGTIQPESTMDITKASRIKIGQRAIEVEIADNPLEQYQGLSGRETLCEQCGMLFVFSNASIQNFSMRGMKFDLDFLFVRGFEVVEIRENIPAPEEGEVYLHIQSGVEADMVLEVNAGFVSRAGVQIGDRLSIDE